MAEWKEVFRNPVRYKAEIVKGVLEKNEINAIVFDHQISSHPIASLGFVKVMVSGDDVIKAMHIIKNEISFQNE